MYKSNAALENSRISQICVLSVRPLHLSSHSDHCHSLCISSLFYIGTIWIIDRSSHYFKANLWLCLWITFPFLCSLWSLIELIPNLLSLILPLVALSRPSMLGSPSPIVMICVWSEHSHYNLLHCHYCYRSLFLIYSHTEPLRIRWIPIISGLFMNEWPTRCTVPLSFMCNCTVYSCQWRLCTAPKWNSITRRIDGWQLDV